MPSNQPIKANLHLGQIVATSNVLSQIPAVEIDKALRRHAACEWGNLDPHDIRENEHALTNGNRILSAYGSGSQRFWIITEADRSVTTILLPQDY